jgi:hypothetical protein
MNGQETSAIDVTSVVREVLCFPVNVLQMSSIRLPNTRHPVRFLYVFDLLTGVLYLTIVAK